jgi:hypothetical protein
MQPKGLLKLRQKLFRCCRFIASSWCPSRSSRVMSRTLVVRPKARRSGEDNRRANSKQTLVLQLLRRPSGATIARARN